jgi:L-threonylcarbamoyladenylate synthase
MIKSGKNIDYASRMLKDDGIVVIPTETVYGLGGNAININSINKIYSLKKRPKNDPLICHTDSLDKILKHVNKIPETAYKLAEKFWPGPMTIIFEKKNIIPNLTTSNLNTVAFRIPKKKITLELFKSLNFPVAAPSANIFGYISPTSIEHVHKNFSNGIDYILDGGNCKLGIESTILGLKKNKILIYRLGSLILNDIKKIGDIELFNNEENYPGSFKTHYSPRKKLYIGDIKSLCKSYQHKKIGILCFDKKYEYVDKKKQIVLSDKSCLNEASRNLYSSLYKLDSMKNIEIIISSLLPNDFIGTTINDRLKKSAE